ncbi:MAG: amidohydrolase [Desulfobulbaceae bacterium]|nr:amidohydrolase [Desulfobulbaceae bacterium]
MKKNGISENMRDDLLIVNGMLLSLSQEANGVISEGFVRIRDGIIVETGSMDVLPQRCSSQQTIDAAGCLVMPGLVNCHNHCAMTLFRGLADDLPLMTWLEQYIFPAEARFVSEEMVYWCTKLAAAEMIMSGTTTVADSYFYESTAAKALRESGMRAIAGHGIIDFPAPGVADPADNISTVEQFIDEWGADERISPAVFCHSPYTCGPETLKKAKDLARSKGVDYFIHLAESRSEIDQIRQQYGVSPVEHLHALGVLDSSTVCVHCVWLEERDLDILKESSARVVTCPASNMKLASGIAPLSAMLERNIVVGLGTDGCASNNNLDLFLEMDHCAKLHKVHHLDPAVMPAAKVLEMATFNGAAALGLDQFVGRIEAGKKADLIVVDFNKPHLTPFYNQDILVYATMGSDVRTVIIDGQLVMRDKEIVTFDLARTLAEVRKLARTVEAG